jgi:hypothetical protein
MGGDRFVRWQNNAMAQLSTALALLVGLSVGGLGFLFALVRDQYFVARGFYALLFLLALVAFFVASVSGVAAVITRLLDFRLTAQKIRTSVAAEKSLKYFGSDAADYGKATWRLIWTLCISFFIAVLLSSIVLSNVYLGRIVDAI